MSASDESNKELLSQQLAAAQTALAQAQLDKAEFDALKAKLARGELNARAEFDALKAKLALAKEAIRATAGLQRIAETERDQYKAKLAKYERAKMPEEPERLTMTRALVSGGVATETVIAAHKYGDLRTFAAAQTVRADANGRRADAYKNLLVEQDITTEYVDAALKDAP